MHLWIWSVGVDSGVLSKNTPVCCLGPYPPLSEWSGLSESLCRHRCCCRRGGDHPDGQHQTPKPPTQSANRHDCTDNATLMMQKSALIFVIATSVTLRSCNLCLWSSNRSFPDWTCTHSRGVFTQHQGLHSANSHQCPTTAPNLKSQPIMMKVFWKIPNHKEEVTEHMWPAHHAAVTCPGQWINCTESKFVKKVSSELNNPWKGCRQAMGHLRSLGQAPKWGCSNN